MNPTQKEIHDVHAACDVLRPFIAELLVAGRSDDAHRISSALSVATMWVGDAERAKVRAQMTLTANRRTV